MPGKRLVTRSALLAAESRALSPGRKAGLRLQQPALRTHPGGPTFLQSRWPWHAAGAGRGPEPGGPARPPGSRGLSQRCPRAASQTQPATTCEQKQCGQAGTRAPAAAPARGVPGQGETRAAVTLTAPALDRALQAAGEQRAGLTGAAGPRPRSGSAGPAAGGASPRPSRCRPAPAGVPQTRR